MRVVGERSRSGRRYYISSRALTAETMLPRCERIGASRTGFTGSSTSLQRDANTVAKDNAPQNLSMLRKIALNIIRADKNRHAQEQPRLKRKGQRGMTGCGAHAGDQINMLGECGGL